MPRFAVDIEKLYQGEYWTNRYFVEATNLIAAQGHGQSIVTVERGLHKAVVEFTKFRTSDVVPNTDIYVTTPINLAGTVAVNGELLPLFNVLRVDFGVLGAGRPSRKFYRLPVGEGEQSDGRFLLDTLSSIVGLLAPLLSIPITDPQGQLWNSAAPARAVGMRQLRRGAKRRLLPIIV